MIIPGTNRGARLAGPFINQQIDGEFVRRTASITNGVRRANNGIVYANPVTEGPSDYMRYVQEKLKPPSPLAGFISPRVDGQGKTRLPRDAYDPSDPIGAARIALDSAGQRLEQTAGNHAPRDVEVLARAADALKRDDPELAPHIDDYQQGLGDRLAKRDRITLPGDAPVSDRNLSYRETGGEQEEEHDRTEVLTPSKSGHDVLVIDDGELYGDAEQVAYEVAPERPSFAAGPEETALLRRAYAVVSNEALNSEAPARGRDFRDGGAKHLFPKDRNTTGRGDYNDDPTNTHFTVLGMGLGGLDAIRAASAAGNVDRLNEIFRGRPLKGGRVVPLVRNYSIPAIDPRLQQFVIGANNDGSHRVRLPNNKEFDVPGGLQGEFDPINFWRTISSEETPIHRVKKQSEVFGTNEETGALLVKHPKTGELTDFYPVASLDETGYHNGRLDSKYRYDLAGSHDNVASVVKQLHDIELLPPSLDALHEGLAWGGIYGVKKAPSVGTAALNVMRTEINNLSVPEQTGYGGRARGNPTIASSDRVDAELQRAIDRITGELAQPDLPDARRAELLAGREQALAAMQPENRDPGKIAARTAAAIAREADTRQAVQAMSLRDMAIKGDDGALAQLPEDQHEQIRRLREVHRQQAAGIPEATIENVLLRGQGPNRFLGRRTNDVIEIVDGPTVDPDKLLGRKTPNRGGGPSWDRTGLGPGQDPFKSNKEPTTPGAMVTYPIGRLLELPPEEQARALQTVPPRALPAPGIAETGDFRETAVQIARGGRPSQDFDSMGIAAEQLSGLPAVQGYGGGPRRAILPAVRTPAGTISARPGAGARPGEPIFVRGAQEAEAPIPRNLEGVWPAPALRKDDSLPAQPLLDLPLDVAYVGSGGRQLRADQAAARQRAGLTGAEPGTRLSKPGRTRQENEAAARELQARLTPDWAAGAQGPHYSEAAVQDALAAAHQVLDGNT